MTLTIRIGASLGPEGSSAGRILLSLALFLSGSFSVIAQVESPSAEQLFLSRVKPLLERKCFACHDTTKGKREGGLDLSSRESMLVGGDSGDSVVVPGEPDESLLFQAVTWQSIEMPPKENDRLSSDEVASIQRWIQEGAPWPETSPAEFDAPAFGDEGRLRVPTREGTTEAWSQRLYAPADLWAFQPWEPIKQPLTSEQIDELIAERQKDFARQHDLPPWRAPLASRRQLIIRLTYDLTGLPPTSEQLERFEQDARSDAVVRLIDRLLASNRYGERWAQHWLDVVRYADTAGFANDFERPHAWRYRDYVIRSLNRDKSIERFMHEQLAGDELAPDDPEAVIATGFLRMGPWEHTGMSVEAVTRQAYLDDVTNAVGETFLGINMSCFRCHDHKFDPLPTQDYYRFQAVFAPTQFGDRALPFQDYENTQQFATGKVRMQKVLTASQQVLAELAEKAKAGTAEFLREHQVQSVDELPPDLRGQARYAGLSDLEKSIRKVTNKRLAYYRRALARYAPFAYSVYDGPFLGYAGIQSKATYLLPPASRREGPAPAVHVLRGGALESPGEEVPPGVLSLLGSRGSMPADMAKRRLRLARWLTDEARFVTARVFVNRVWQHHFGRGLFATPNAVGKMGSKPTHPVLLDALARDFVAHGWSLKRLHRLILGSQTYQLASADPPPAWRDADPGNQWWSCFPPRRLSAEELRDTLLHVTGELNLEMGGPGCYPEINWDVALQPRQIMGTVAPAYQPSRTPAQRHRRTIYAVRIRTLPDPLLEVMNRPHPDVSCAVRNETTVTPQVLSLFNGQFAHDRALALAKRVAEVSPDPRDQVRTMFQALLLRLPDPEEQAALRRHLDTMRRHHQRVLPQPVPVPKSVYRGMVEELTGNLYEYEERLTLMEDYVEDTKPWDVSAEVRALAEIGLVLINSNEFSYVY